MRVVSITIVTHETDLLEAFVRHHGLAMSKMVLLLKCSRAAVKSLITALAAEGFPLEVHETDDPTYREPEEQTALMRDIRSRLAPDWILPLDCDEFLRPGARSRTLGEAFGGLPDRLLRLPWRTYVPGPQDDVQEPNVLKRIQHRRASELTQFYKVFVPRSVFEARDVYFSMGPHEFLEREGGKEIPASDTELLSIAHFPIRSGQQAASKAFTGWLALASHPKRKADSGFQWKELFDRCKAGGEPSVLELQRLAYDYALAPANRGQPLSLVHDPVPTVPEAMRYPHEQHSALAELADAAERIAYELSKHRRSPE